jgi:hypothetical protein
MRAFTISNNIAAASYRLPKAKGNITMLRSHIRQYAPQPRKCEPPQIEMTSISLGPTTMPEEHVHMRLTREPNPKIPSKKKKWQ